MHNYKNIACVYTHGGIDNKREGEGNHENYCCRSVEQFP